MTEQTNKYRVKEGKTIFHRDVVFSEGSLVELTAEKALVHAPNIDLVKEPKTEANKKAEVKPDAGKP